MTGKSAAYLRVRRRIADSARLTDASVRAAVARRSAFLHAE